jgi:hypothetical protein
MAMAYFGAPDDRVFHDPKSGLQPWPASPEGYRFYVSGTGGDERIGIQTGTVVLLQLTAAKDCRIETNELTLAVAAAGAAPGTSRGLLDAAPASVLPIQLVTADSAGHAIIRSELTPEIATSNKHLFKLWGRQPGRTSLSAYDAAGVRQARLDVIVGDFAKHPSMSIDLIPDVGRGSDSLKILALQRMLNNRWGGGAFTNVDNIFEQNGASNRSSDPKIGHWTCGIVARYRPEQIFGKIPMPADDWYTRPLHEPLSGKVLTKRSDVKYKSAKIAAVVAQIVAALNKRQAVRVGVLDDPVDLATGFRMQIIDGKLIAYYGGGHSVIIVGCNAAGTEFLYIDPWGGGSALEYKGGIAGNQVAGKCEQLGLFTLLHDPDRKATSTDNAPNMIRGSALTEGSFNVAAGNYLEVVSAPF